MQIDYNNTCLFIFAKDLPLTISSLTDTALTEENKAQRGKQGTDWLTLAMRDAYGPNRCKHVTTDQINAKLQRI